MPPQTLIVTGASRGIGAATARTAAELGAHVVLCARSETELAVVARQITEAGGKALSVVADVSRREDCRRLVHAAVERFGGLDALVSNAATLEPVEFVAASDPEAWQHALAVNVLGPLMLAQVALPHLRARKGRIIDVSSGAASIPVSGLSAYCASKAALNIFGQCLAKEEPDVTVIAFEPGVVDTAMQTFIRTQGRPRMLPADHALFVGMHEQGHLRPPDDAGRVLAHVALRAPRDWSGTIVAWNDERVQRLING
jgi:NAD(P)-dependent dehydrogenase (short-subunit alcohol dehydrogenase family)